MSIRHDRPVPTSIRHRATWRRPRRVCVCGLSWPCQDRPRIAQASRWSSDATTLRRLLDGLRGWKA